jgi:hypothetical protein
VVSQLELSFPPEFEDTMTTDISLRDFGDFNLGIAAPVDGNGRNRDRNMGSQRWDYPTEPEPERAFQRPGESPSRDSSLHGGDTVERQVSK